MQQDSEQVKEKERDKGKLRDGRCKASPSTCLAGLKLGTVSQVHCCRWSKRASWIKSFAQMPYKAQFA